LSEAQLTWYSRTGERLGTLGTTARTTRPFPRISPDETQVACAVAFGDDREIYLFDTATGNQRRLTFDQVQQEVVAWIDDETLLYYENNSYNLSRMSLDGQTKLLGVGILPSVTPDHSEIIASRIREHWDWDLMALTPDGSQERVLLENPGVQWFGQVSPNGRYLVYQSDETGVIEVFVTTFPNASTRWQLTTDGGQQPMWSSDGSEIFFTTRNKIGRIAVRTDKGLRFDPPETLFERPSIDWSASWADGFDVSDDGQRFVLWAPEPVHENEQPRIVIVHNWYEEFRQR
jgi:Tol biopolymer transport system component